MVDNKPIARSWEDVCIGYKELFNKANSQLRDVRSDHVDALDQILECKKRIKKLTKISIACLIVAIVSGACLMIIILW